MARAPEDNQMRDPPPVLFLDWRGVERGFLDACLEPRRVCESGRNELAKLAELGRKFTQTGHALRRRMLPHGVTIAVEPARKSPRWLVVDRPWEGTLNGPTVIHEEGRYRCWYLAIPPKDTELAIDRDRGMEVSDTYLCYTESEDGVHWTKPDLGIIPFRGETATNIVSIDGNGGAVFRDDTAVHSERYKLLGFDKLHDVSDDDDVPVMRRYGLYGVVSPDGYHWTRLEKPLIRYFCDTQNIATWDADASQYVGYFRSHASGRSISRSATRDFADWPEPETIMYAGAEDQPALDYYTNCFTRHPDDPSRGLMFPGVFHRNSDRVDVRLAVSLNGVCFNWVSRDPVLAVGGPGDWDSGSVYGHPNLVRLPGGELALPYCGTNRTHEEGWFDRFYGDYPPDLETGFAWAVWDDARLAGVAAADFGEFWTLPVPFDGERIEINARTSQSGSARVELWDGEGERPIPGFTLDEAVPLSGDRGWTPCRWNGATADLSAIRGRSIRLRFRLSCATVFGYRLTAGQK